MSFWITFALAVISVERGHCYIGILCTLSVLRAARLLAITPGATVSQFRFNRFVASITNTFSAIRKDTHQSAFGAAP